MQGSGRDPTAAEEMAGIGGRGGTPPGLGALGDHDVRATSMQLVALGQAALEDLPACWVE